MSEGERERGGKGGRAHQGDGGYMLGPDMHSGLFLQLISRDI